jgi:bifunctional DNA-binding transcriptional regulator/antitoxin component of YhaV-PrlF toxin-antitoxin module
MSRISTRNRVTLPVDVLRAAGLATGDEISIRAVGRGVLRIQACGSVADDFAGIFDRAVYPEGYLQRLRDEAESRSG